MVFLIYSILSILDGLTTWIAIKFFNGYEMNSTSVVNFLPNPLLLPIIEVPIVWIFFKIIEKIGKNAYGGTSTIALITLTVFRSYPIIHNVMEILKIM